MSEARRPTWLAPALTLLVSGVAIADVLRGPGPGLLVVLGCQVWSGMGSFANKLYWIPWWARAGFLIYGAILVLAVVFGS